MKLFLVASKGTVSESQGTCRRSEVDFALDDLIQHRGLVECSTLLQGLELQS